MSQTMIWQWLLLRSFCRSCSFLSDYLLLVKWCEASQFFGWPLFYWRILFILLSVCCCILHQVCYFILPQPTAATQELFLLISSATSGGGSFVSRLAGEGVLHYFSLTKIRRGWDTSSLTSFAVARI